MGWVAEETARPKNSRVGKALGLRERTKRDFSTAQTDTFAGAKAEEKASVCFGRNDKFVEMLTAGLPLDSEKGREGVFRAFFCLTLAGGVLFLFGVGAVQPRVRWNSRMKFVSAWTASRVTAL
jgi:hypothetical protein